MEKARKEKEMKEKYKKCQQTTGINRNIDSSCRSN
jgi:hypothetical protein